MTHRLLRHLIGLTAACALLAGCASQTPPAPSPATGPAATTPTATETPVLTPAGPKAETGALSVAWVAGWPNLEVRPLYGSVAADRPAVARLAEMVAAAEYPKDSGVTGFPVARPHSLNLHIIYPDGRLLRVTDAFRCTQPNNAMSCQGAPGFVLIDGRPAHAPALAAYYAGKWRDEMPPLGPGDLLTFVQPSLAPGTSSATVKAGDPLEVKGSGAVTEPLPLLLVGPNNGGRASEWTLGKVETPAGKWSWQGKVPADLVPGSYTLYAGRTAVELVVK